MPKYPHGILTKIAKRFRRSLSHISRIARGERRHPKIEAALKAARRNPG